MKQTTVPQAKALNLDELIGSMPRSGTFHLRLNDGRLDRIAAEGSSVEFRRLPKADKQPEKLRSRILIVKSPSNELMIGKFDFFPTQDSDGNPVAITVTLRPQSKGDYSRHQWSVPVADWPAQFDPIAHLEV